MKIFVTKYSLTRGILIFDNAIQVSETMVSVAVEGTLAQYFHRNEWHKTRDAAVFIANEMREAKIKSLAKQIVKLERTRFE